MTYPCRWEYKVIGPDEGRLREAIAAVAGAREHKVSHSRTSAGGKYHSLLLDMTAESEQDRTDTFQALSRHPGVRMVI